METMPTEYEKEWATFLMQQGVDVVIGGHRIYSSHMDVCQTKRGTVC